jgi:hypothetical protein
MKSSISFSGQPTERAEILTGRGKLPRFIKS